MHHAPFEQNEPPSDLALIVYCANIICKNNGIGLVMEKPPITIHPSAYEKLGIDKSIEKEILDTIGSEIIKATEFLKV